jgi:hypothetical protein
VKYTTAPNAMLDNHKMAAITIYVLVFLGTSLKAKIRVRAIAGKSDNATNNLKN